MNARIIAAALVLLRVLTASAQPPVVGKCAVLPADSIWNTPVDQLPVSGNSSTWVATIGSTKTIHADFGSGLYNGGPIGIPYITVRGTQTKYPASFTYAGESEPGPYAIPLNARIRLRTGIDISGFSPVNQVILRALKKYGMMLADNGSAWYISGAPDERWDNNDLHNLGVLKGSDFEAVDVSGLMIDANSGQAKQSDTAYVTVTPSTASVAVNATQQFTATVTNST